MIGCVAFSIMRENNCVIFATQVQSFPRSIRHVAISSKNWFGPVKGYSLLDQMGSRNLSTSSVEYVNACKLDAGSSNLYSLLDRVSIQLQLTLRNTAPVIVKDVLLQ